jgi:glycosyltransferase involved in cell wall biosynthesis
MTGNIIKVAIDARPLCHPGTGIHRYTYELLKRLVEYDYELYLYSDKRVSIDKMIAERDNVHVRQGRIKYSFLSSLYAQIFFPIWAYRDGVEVFWSPRHHLPLFLPAKILCLLSIHDIVWVRFGDTMTRFGRLLESILMPLSIKKADKVFPVSYFTQREIEEIFSVPSAKICYIPNASYLSNGSTTSAAGIVDSGMYYLFVGTAEPRKNLKNLISAYKIYYEASLSPIILKIAGGTGWGGINVSTLIEQAGLNGVVEHVGYVSDLELQRLYENAYAILLPSLYEGFGLPAVEAISVNKPVITSRHSAMEEVAGDAALTVDPYSIEDIASALEKLSSDEKLYNELCENAAYRRHLFCWDQSAATLNKTIIEAHSSLDIKLSG